MSADQVQKITLRLDNIASAVTTVNSVTNAQLQADQPDRQAILTGATMVAQDDVFLDKVLVIPSTPCDNAGRLTATADTINGIENPSHFAVLKTITLNHSSVATQEDLVTRLMCYTGGQGAPFGPPNSIVVLKTPISVIQIKDDLGEGLIAEFDARREDPPPPAAAGINNPHHPPARATDRQEFDDAITLQPLFITEPFRRLFFPGVDNAGDMSPSTISLKSAALIIDRKFNELFNTSLHTEMVLSAKDKNGLLLFSNFELTAFVAPPLRSKSGVYSVSECIQMVTQVARLMEGIYTPVVTQHLQAMAQNFANFLSLPDHSDGSAVARAVLRQFTMVPSHIRANPGLSPVTAVTQLWTITATSPTIMSYNAALVLEAQRTLEKKVAAMTPRHSSSAPGGNQGSHRNNSNERQHSNGNSNSNGKRPPDQAVSVVFQKWLDEKPEAIKSMSPPLCSHALLPKCPRNKCGFEHDWNKVPAAAQAEARKWLEDKPKMRDAKKPKMVR